MICPRRTSDPSALLKSHKLLEQLHPVCSWMELWMQLVIDIWGGVGMEIEIDVWNGYE